MVILKDFELSVNQSTISLKSKKDQVTLWYEATKLYFEQNGFEIIDERKLNNDKCEQIKVKNKDEFYILDFFCTGRTVITTKQHQQLFLEKHIPELEKRFNVTFKIKNAKTSPSKPESVVKHHDDQSKNDNNNKQQDANITTYKSKIPITTKALDGLRAENNALHEISSPENQSNHHANQASTSTNDSNVQPPPFCLSNSKNSKTNPQNGPDKEPIELNNTTQTMDPLTKVVTALPRNQKEFNEKIEVEQIKITEEFNQLRLDLDPIVDEMKKLQKELCPPTNLINEIMANVRKLITPLQEEINTLKSQNKTLQKKIDEIQNNSKSSYTTNTQNNESDLDFYIKTMSETQVQQEQSIKVINDKINEKISSINEKFNETNKNLEVLSSDYKKNNDTLQEIEKFINAAEARNDNNPWFTMGPKGKPLAQNDEDTEQLYEDKKVIDTVIFGDSIVKRIEPEKITKNTEESLNYAVSGAKVKHIYDQYRLFSEEHNDVNVRNVIVHVGCNHLPRDDPDNVVQKICKLLSFLESNLPNANIFYSGIIPKYSNKSINMISYINTCIYHYCLRNNRLNFILHKLFVTKMEMNDNLYWKDYVHPNRHGLRQLAKDFINAVRYKRF